MSSNHKSGNRKARSKGKGHKRNGQASPKGVRWDPLLEGDDDVTNGRCEWQDVDLEMFDPEFQRRITEAEHSGIGSNFNTVHEHQGLKIWRISDYRVVHWPEELYGHFYEDEAFLALHSERSMDGTKRRHHIHIWTGKGVTNSTEDYATGACKAAELDERLKFEAEVHREVQGKESTRFRSYFKPFVIWRGSSGDNYFSNPDKSRPARLLRLYHPDRRWNNVVLKEVPAHTKSLNNENIFLLDLGKSIIQWNGDHSDEMDRKNAIKYFQIIKRKRGGRIKFEEIQEGTSHNHTFHAYLKTNMDFSDNGVDSDDETQNRISVNAAKLQRPQPRLITPNIKEEELLFSIHKEGNLHFDDFKQHAVCIFDNSEHCFVWIGQKASLHHRRMAVEFGHEYLRTTDHALIPYTVIKEGLLGREFQEALVAV